MEKGGNSAWAGFSPRPRGRSLTQSTSPWHDTGVRTPGALTVRSPCRVRLRDGAVVRPSAALRRSAGGKVFPSSMRGTRGWCCETRRAAEHTVWSGNGKVARAVEKQRCPGFSDSFGGHRRRREPVAPVRGKRDEARQKLDGRGPKA
jgi:hypothetical protein